jgi:diguanylate cyclase (GGDEF)-like protein
MRGQFEADARAILVRATNENTPVSLIVADIDHFKRINDGWGHAIGDSVINKVGTLISSTIRDHDVAGRIGGEEFCIMVWNCDGAAAARLAERLRKAATKLDDAEVRGGLSLTMSFGVAQAGPNDNYSHLFDRADGYLYQAKNGGRNRVVANGEVIQCEERRSKAAEIISIHG